MPFTERGVQTRFDLAADAKRIRSVRAALAQAVGRDVPYDEGAENYVWEFTHSEAARDPALHATLGKLNARLVFQAHCAQVLLPITLTTSRWQDWVKELLVAFFVIHIFIWVAYAVRVWRIQ